MSAYTIIARRFATPTRHLTCIACSPKAAALIGAMAFPGRTITVQPKHFPFSPGA